MEMKTCSPQNIEDFAALIEDTWTEWADEVVMDAAADAVTAMRELVHIIRHRD